MSFSGNLTAEVITDGSLGKLGVQTVSGPIYSITENLGQRQGNNLFHSFSHFNVSSGETATFQSALTTANIFARVTGNEVSSIDGTVATTAGSNANLWLINPQGWIIGSQAKFNVNGAFHLTTADAIGFNDGSKFFANPAQASQLSVSAPLTLELDKPTQATITIDQANLQFAPQQTVSLTAPKLVLNRSALTVPGGNLLLGGLSSGSWTLSQQGLKGMSAALGEILINGHLVKGKQSVAISTSQQLQATDSHNTNLYYGGLVQLLSGSINLRDAEIKQTSLGDNPGGDIALQAQTITLDKKSLVLTDTKENGDAGNISIAADNLSLSDFSAIQSSSQIYTQGNAGAININLHQGLALKTESNITAITQGLGTGGTINIDADHLSLQNNSAIQSNANDIGPGGNINILAKQNTDLSAGGTIISSSLTQGNAGTIALKTPQLSMTDRETLISSKSFGSGRGGEISIQTDRLNLLNQAEIRTSSIGKGDAGNIQLSATQQFWMENNAKVTTQAEKSNGGAIDMTTDTAYIRHSLMTTSVGDLAISGNAGGKGGDIHVLANHLITDGGFIQANTTGQNASGGDIVFDPRVHLIAGGNQIEIGGLQRRQFDTNTRDNIIQAASELGNPGNISFPRVELNIAGQLLALDSRILHLRAINENPCQVLRGQALSSLVSVGNGSLPVTLKDFATTSLEAYLTPTDITTLLPKGGNASEIYCPENPL